MPIRFRCAYCHQLMAIARRKVGAVVRCPRCAGEVIVPGLHQPPAPPARQLSSVPEDGDAEEEAYANPRAEPEPAARPMPAPFPPLPPPAPAAHAETAPEPHPAASDAFTHDLRRTGVFLPVPALVTGAAFLLALLGLIFVLGFALGRWTGH